MLIQKRQDLHLFIKTSLVKLKKELNLNRFQKCLHKKRKCLFKIIFIQYKIQVNHF